MPAQAQVAPHHGEIDRIITRLNKKYGAGTIVRGRDRRRGPVPRITTGSLAVDVSLGGGWAANQWNEVVGDESHGKTALVLKTIAANQQADPGFYTLWIASEDFNDEYAEMCGVDIDRIDFVEDNSMEIAYQACVDSITDRAVDCIVIDSLPALTPTREEEATMEDFQPGLPAFLTGKFFRMSNSARKGSVVDSEARLVTGLVINQWREKIGVTKGDPRTTPGGKAKNFWYYIRVEVRRDEWITNTRDRRIGQTLKVRNIKNKTAPSGSIGVVDFYFANGAGMHAGEFDVLKETVNLGIDFEVVERKGSYYVVGADQWQGKERLVDAMRDDESLFEDIRKQVMALVVPGAEVLPETPDDEAPKEKAITRRKKTAE